jgi:hypothetical protein
VSESRRCSPGTKNVTAHQHNFHRTWDTERERKAQCMSVQFRKILSW